MTDEMNFAVHSFRESSLSYFESSRRLVLAHLPFRATAFISSPQGHLPALLDMPAHEQDAVFMQAHT